MWCSIVKQETKAVELTWENREGWLPTLIIVNGSTFMERLNAPLLRCLWGQWGLAGQAMKTGFGYHHPWRCLWTIRKLSDKMSPIGFEKCKVLSETRTWTVDKHCPFLRSLSKTACFGHSATHINHPPTVADNFGQLISEMICLFRYKPQIKIHVGSLRGSFKGWQI